MIRKIQSSFSIGDVARMAGVESRDLRTWEESGLLPPARRDEANHRVYSFDEARALVDRTLGPRRRRLAVVNQKGGVGKTTTAFNLAGAFVARGRRVLAIDLDPQANLTSSLGVRVEDGRPTVEELFVEDDAQAAAAVLDTRFPGLSCIPARPRFAGVEIKIFDAFLRETILDRKLRPLHDEYDVILLDCPPNLSLVTVNALVACEEAIVPIEAQAYSIKAISDLTNTVALIRNRLDRGVVLRFLPTKIDGRIKASREILAAVREGLEGRVLPSVRTDAHLVRAPMVNAPVAFSYPASKGAKDYAQVADLLLREEAAGNGEPQPAAKAAPAAAPDEGPSTAPAALLPRAVDRLGDTPGRRLGERLRARPGATGGRTGASGRASGS